MSSGKWVAIGGAILGSLAEEGLEEVFPGIGELALEGEVTGTFTALVATDLMEEETRDALESFIKFVYRQINDEEAKNISEEEIKGFSENFDKIPEEEKKKIINNYKNIAPYEYALIKDFIQENAYQS